MPDVTTAEQAITWKDRLTLVALAIKVGWPLFLALIVAVVYVAYRQNAAKECFKMSCDSGKPPVYLDDNCLCVEKAK